MRGKSKALPEEQQSPPQNKSNVTYLTTKSDHLGCPLLKIEKQRKDDALRIAQLIESNLKDSKEQESTIKLECLLNTQKPIALIDSTIISSGSDSVKKTETCDNFSLEPFVSHKKLKRFYKKKLRQNQNRSFHIATDKIIELNKLTSASKGQNPDEIFINFDSDIEYIGTTYKDKKSKIQNLDEIVIDLDNDVEYIGTVFKNKNSSPKPGNFIYSSKHLSQKKLLLVSDLNGVLVYRAKKMPFLRPHIREFMDFIFENFHVVVWSSARPLNVDLMINEAFKKYKRQVLVAWSRNQCDLDGHYNSRCETVKDMRNLWKRLKYTSDSFGVTFEASNTIVIDDSPSKIKLQPDNQILIKEYASKDPEDVELKKLTSYLKLLVAEYSKDPDPESYDVRDFLKNIKYSEFQPDLGSPIVLEPSLQIENTI